MPAPRETLTRALLRDLASLVWPTECLGCEVPDRDLCERCRMELRSSHTTQVVAPVLGAESFWAVSGPYEGVRRNLIVAYKHQTRVVFARELGIALAQPLAAVLQRSPVVPVLVPIPSRPGAHRERGFRHLDLVVRHAIRRLGLSGRVRVIHPLVTARGRTGQVGLNDQQRIENAARVRVTRRGGRQLLGRYAVLIDDVVTTGATLAAAEMRLRAAGATVVGACGLAAVRKLQK